MGLDQSRADLHSFFLLIRHLDLTSTIILHLGGSAVCFLWWRVLGCFHRLKLTFASLKVLQWCVNRVS